MNRAAVAGIAICVLLVAAFIGTTDPSRNGQQLFMALGLFASIVILIGIISLAGEVGSTRGDTSQVVNVYVPAQPAAPPPAAAPQVVYVQLPPQAQPTYLPQYAPQPHYLPPQYESAPARAYYPQPQYRGALDVVAEPVHGLQYHPQPQVQREPVAQLETPQASLARRIARRLVG